MAYLGECLNMPLIYLNSVRNLRQILYMKLLLALLKRSFFGQQHFFKDIRNYDEF